MVDEKFAFVGIVTKVFTEQADGFVVFFGDDVFDFDIMVAMERVFRCVLGEAAGRG